MPSKTTFSTAMWRLYTVEPYFTHRAALPLTPSQVGSVHQNFDWQANIGCFCNLMLIMHRVMHCCDIHYTLHFQAFLPALMAPIACNVHWQHALLCHQAWSAHTASGCEPVPMAVAALQAQLHFASIKSNTFKQQQDVASQAFKARSASALVRRLHS